MILNNKVVVIIPARGGSKGIPRKNLRPLNGKPLIFYSIINAKKIVPPDNIFVSTDDEEIEFFAKKLGVKVHPRSEKLATDAITLDPVIIEAYNFAAQFILDIQYVITMQPTSPLLEAKSIINALSKIDNSVDYDTVISATNSSHLSWKFLNGRFFPNYTERLNRQYLPKTYQETGGFLISTREVINLGKRIGENVLIQELSAKEAIDIDSYDDWSLCEYYLQQKHILFRVSGNNEIGLGHVYNCLGIASEILNHKVSFLVDEGSNLALEKISEFNFPVKMQRHHNILEDIKEISPDLVINDCLNTSKSYILSLKDEGFKVLNIEDLGEGSKHADIVINAIYPEKKKYENHFYGPEYFCCRDEFLFHEPKVIVKKVREILISFGGVDPNNLTAKVLESIYDHCRQDNLNITVITGLGYDNYESLKKFSKIKLIKNVRNISDYFHRADIVFSSAGRTIYELALLGTPTIVLAQNKRELSHFFAYEKFGFINLGLGVEVTNQSLLKTFLNYSDDYKARKIMSEKMLSHEISKGKERVKYLILKLLQDEN